MTQKLIAGLIMLSLAGCTPLVKRSEAESAAQRHVGLAERFERGYLFREATLEYSIVAERYPATSVYPSSVLHLALLYGNPANPVRNDSLALHWTKVYLALPLSKGERESAQLYFSLIERIASLEQELVRQNATFDSLAATSQRLGNIVPSQARRILELETELKQTQDELARLKEVDIRTSKRRAR